MRQGSCGRGGRCRDRARPRRAYPGPLRALSVGRPTVRLIRHGLSAGGPAGRAQRLSPWRQRRHGDIGRAQTGTVVRKVVVPRGDNDSDNRLRHPNTDA